MPSSIPFVTDADGRIVGAGAGCAAMLVGLRLGTSGSAAAARSDAVTRTALAGETAIHAGQIAIDGAPTVAGTWRVDASPCFDAASGGFVGHSGILSRASMVVDEHEWLRLLLHELRTPVHAVQGFAELIGLQLFGPVPQPYLDRAASIAAAAARIAADLRKVEHRLTDNDGGGDPHLD